MQQQSRDHFLSFGLVFLFLFSAQLILAQAFVPKSYPVQLGDDFMQTPWLGGLNCPQVSAIDLNGDEFMDLHIFDRTGNVQLTYIYSGNGSTPAYTYDSTYLKGFPEVDNWMLVRDYNGDDIPDIFSYSDIPGIDGIVVYTGSRENGQLSFERVQFDVAFNLAFFPSSSGNSLQIFVSKIDYPAIEDVDCDGDLDIVTFNISGGYVEWYRNTSVENGNGLNNLDYVLEDGCWGGFFENGITSTVDLAPQAGDCFSPEAGAIAVNFRHAGSTVMLFDPDQDDDMDIVLGDLSFNNLNMLTNAGDCQNAWMSAQNEQFPNINAPVELPTFPASFAVDINQDGIKDLLAAPNLRQGSEDKEVLWYYQTQVEEGGAISYKLQQKDFLVGESIDIGTKAYPAFIDYNGDGKLDMVVGNQFDLINEGQFTSSLHLFENVGEDSAPVFKLVDEDYLGLSQFVPDAYGFSPTFADMDDDGDLDILVGETFGTLFYGENTAGPRNGLQINNWIANYMGIDVGLASYPTVADVDLDGLADLIIGERNGNVNYFKNIGAGHQPQFNATPDDDRFGGINTRGAGFLVGNSTPQVFYRGDKAYILTGSEEGSLSLYASENRSLTQLRLEAESVGNIKVGEGTTVALADLNLDGTYDLVVGNERGGLSVYETGYTAPVITSTRGYEDLSGVEIYPNPAHDWLRIQQNEHFGSWRLRVQNSTGQLMIDDQIHQQSIQVPTAHWPKGIYFAEIIVERRRSVQKIVVQ